MDFAYPRARSGPAPPFAIRDLGFAVAAGEIFGVIGPNASGKTTLIRLLSRVLEPPRGEIRLDGRSRRLSRGGAARASRSCPRTCPPASPSPSASSC